LREQTDEELDQLLRDTSSELFDVKVKNMTGDSSTHPVQMRGLRRDIARIKTEMNRRKAERNV
jgi:ribosomal protein L29